MNRPLKAAHWQHWKHPRTKLWDAQCHKNGNVLFFSRQGYVNQNACLNAVESASGSRESSCIEFSDRVRSPRRKK